MTSGARCFTLAVMALVAMVSLVRLGGEFVAGHWGHLRRAWTRRFRGPKHGRRRPGK